MARTGWMRSERLEGWLRRVRRGRETRVLDGRGLGS
jgi:hypothetical protein